MTLRLNESIDSNNDDDGIGVSGNPNSPARVGGVRVLEEGGSAWVRW